MTGGGTAKEYVQALTDCFNIEEARQDSSEHLPTPGKLSQSWDAHTGFVPNLDKAILDWGKKQADPISRHRLTDREDGGKSYQVMLIGDPSDFLTTIHPTGSIKKASDTYVILNELSRAVWAAVSADQIFTGMVQDLGLEYPNNEVFQWLGVNNETTKQISPEGIEEITKAIKPTEVRKKLIVIDNGFNPVVMTRSAYDYVNYFLQHVKGLKCRVPAFNYPALDRKRIKVPSVMKNFRFDIANLRGLEAATSTTQETFTFFLNRLLKQHLGQEVALKLDSMKFNQTGVAKPLSPTGAEERYAKFRLQTEGFGFEMPKTINDARNDPKAIIEELEFKLNAEKSSNEASRTRSAENLLTAEKATTELTYYKGQAELAAEAIKEMKLEIASLKQQLELANVVQVSSRSTPMMDGDGNVYPAPNEAVEEVVALGEEMDSKFSNLYDKMAAKIDAKIDGFLGKLDVDAGDFKKAKRNLEKFANRSKSKNPERFEADESKSVEERRKDADEWLNEGKPNKGKGVYFDPSFSDTETFEIDWELPREELKQRFSDYLKNKPTKTNRVTADELDELIEADEAKPKAKRKAKKKK